MAMRVAAKDFYVDGRPCFWRRQLDDLNGPFVARFGQRRNFKVGVDDNLANYDATIVIALCPVFTMHGARCKLLRVCFGCSAGEKCAEERILRTAFVRPVHAKNNVAPHRCCFARFARSSRPATLAVSSTVCDR
jgi:hypothetical protein